MTSQRKAICPVCGHSADVGTTCWHCKRPVDISADDHQDVVFVGVDDGYHSWYAQPTNIHERYRCEGYPHACPNCIHEHANDLFCRNGRIDIRRIRQELLDGTVTYRYQDWVERA